MHQLPQPTPSPSLPWDAGSSLQLGAEYGFLSLEGVSDQPLTNARVSHRSALTSELNISRSITKKIKEIMRITGIPPWLRDAVPLLIQGDKLSAVGDWWLAAEFRQQLQGTNQAFRWQPEHALLKKLQSVGRASSA
jgi:tRNA(Ile)-lysidine synthetase-like protein